MNKIREQIKQLRKQPCGVTWTGKSGLMGKAADTMEAMLEVVEAAKVLADADRYDLAGWAPIWDELDNAISKLEEQNQGENDEMQ